MLSFGWRALVAACVLAGHAWAAEPLRIGVASDYSGPYVDLGGPGSALAAKMAVEDFGGSVLGRPVEIVAADTQDKPDVASTFVRNWFDNDGVEAIADGSASSVGLAIQVLAEQKHKIYLNTGGFAAAFSGAACTPSAFQFQPDTRALALAVASATVQAGGKSWFFITANYTFGLALEADATAAVQAAGGTVLGSARAPLNTADFSSYLLQAQASGANVVALANAGNDFVTAVKQAHEFGLAADNKTSLAGLLVLISDVDALGLSTAQGLQFGDAAYWNENAATRAWSERFMARHGGKPPTTVHAMTYSGVTGYLKAVQAAGTTDGVTVANVMHERKLDDIFLHDAIVQPNGRVMTDILLVRVKSPGESKFAYDDYTILERLKASTLYRPVEDSGCKLSPQTTESR